MSRGAQNAILRRIALEISHKMTLQQKKKNTADAFIFAILGWNC